MLNVRGQSEEYQNANSFSLGRSRSDRRRWHWLLPGPRRSLIVTKRSERGYNEEAIAFRRGGSIRRHFGFRADRDRILRRA
jgi:hypothetical protein